MSEKNRDKLIKGILYYKEVIKNSEDNNKEYIEKCKKRIEEFSEQLKVTEFGEDEVEYEKVSRDEIKRRIILDYEGRISDWN